ncbi:hypothetical protein A1D31_37425 [Bradyrhizobium liaoningense]|nr:hypothetical protein A1D31_37425 [Bradyrhizobium liaoningense]
MVKMVAASTDVNLPLPNTQLDEQQKALRLVLSDYKSAQARMQSTMIGLRGTTQLALDGSVAVLVGSGVGAIPAIVLKTTGQIATDALFDHVQKDVDTAIAGYLGSKKNQLTSIAGTSYETLKGLPPQELKARLESSTTVLADLKAILPDDVNVQKMAETLVVEGIRNTQRATLDQLAADEKRITNVSIALNKFKDQTANALKVQAEALGDLSVAVGDLSSAVSSIDKRLNSMAHDQSFVADFVLSQMPPAAKASALKNNFLSNRFSCSDGGTQCDAAKLKEDLIKRFEAEAKVQAVAGSIQLAASNINNVAAIANNIGLGSPELNKAAELASLTSNAVASFATGNYLGAVVAVTGMFAKKTDPDAERFKVLMGYLKQQFEIVNQKLDQILTNQQKLLNAMVDLSKQMQSYYEALDERLGNIEFETKRISGLAANAAWADWISCFAVHNYIRNNEATFGAIGNGDFSRVEHMQAVLGALGKEVIANCLNTAVTKPPSIAAGNWFGNFLDADTAYSFYPPVLPAPEEASGKFYKKDALRAFIDGVHTPAVSIIDDFRARKGIPPWRLFALLNDPSSSATEISDRVSMSGPQKPPCGADGVLGDRLQRLLCGAVLGPDNAAMFLLRKPMLIDGAVDVSSWVMTVARFADIRDPNSGDFWKTDELLHAASQNRLGSGGKEIMLSLLMAVDAAVASYSMYYGDIAAQAVFDALTTAQSTDAQAEARRVALQKAATTLVNANGYLASNVALIKLRAKHTPTSVQAYRTALDHARTQKDDRFHLLNALFGSELKFSSDASGKLFLEIAVKDDNKSVVATLPTPEILLNGRISYPPRMAELISTRTRIIERILDYQFLETRPASDRAEVATLVARAERASRK